MKKVFILCLVLILSLSVFGCKCNETNHDNEGETGEKQLEVVADKRIIDDSKTEYEILLSQNASALEEYAAGEITSFFYEASGIELNKTYDGNYDSSKNYFSIGNTKLISGDTFFDSENNSQAFCIKTIDYSIAVVGNSDTGTLWGVYELLTQLFNYEYYSADTFYIDKNVSNLPLYKFDIKDEPDIEYRATADGQSYNDLAISRRFRFLKSDKEVFLIPGDSWNHNSFSYYGGSATAIKELNADFLADSEMQLCYTAHGNEESLDQMLEIAKDKILIAAQSNPTNNNVMVGMEDNYGNCCNCDSCNKMRETYGSNSASVIIFCNKLHRKLEQYFNDNNINRSINVIFFAYNDFEEVPAVKDGNGNYVAISEDVKLDKGVYPMYAPIFADWSLPLNDSRNSAYYDRLKQWMALSETVYLWSYHTNYSYFLYPYDCFNSVQQNYKIFADEFNIKYSFNQGKHKDERGSAFFALIEYLNSKLSWNVNANVGQLTADFFANYFGPASETMMQYYKELRNVLAHDAKFNGMNGGVYSQINDATFWPEATVINWLGLIDKAYSDIEKIKDKDSELYKKIYDHIKIESISLRTIYIENYAVDGSSEQQNMIKELISDCQNLNVGYYSELETVEAHFTK